MGRQRGRCRDREKREREGKIESYGDREIGRDREKERRKKQTNKQRRKRKRKKALSPISVLTGIVLLPSPKKVLAMISLGCEELFLRSRSKVEELPASDKPELNCAIVAVVSYNSPYYHALAMKILAQDAWNSA
jgi:hypothetical protein